MHVAPGIFTMAVVMVNFDSKSTKINIPVPQPMLVWGGTHMGVAQRRSNQIYKQGDPRLHTLPNYTKMRG